MSASVHSQIEESTDPRLDAPLLRTSAVVTTDDQGRLVATLELHGELCAGAAPVLRSEVERLLDDGVVVLTVHLGALRLCTSDGLEIWQDADQRLRSLGGSVQLVGASGVVREVLEVVEQADPSFSPIVETRAPRGSGQVTAQS